MSAVPQLRSEPPASDATPELYRLEAQKMEAIGRLVSGVAHDFNNLLTGIVLCSDLLVAGLDKGSHLRRYAQEIGNAGARGAGLIQQLLAVAQQRSIETQALSLNDAIIEMNSLLARLIGENIQLVSELEGDLALVQMAPAQVQQIILNLVLNARDAMPAGGRITLTTRNQPEAAGGGKDRESHGTVVFEVSDSGYGMDADTRSRIFEPFFTTKKMAAGNGLGLATVKTIVNNSGGAVVVESAPGNGTRVQIRLPAIPRPQAAQHTETGHWRTPATQPESGT